MYTLSFGILGSFRLSKHNGFENLTGTYLTNESSVLRNSINYQQKLYYYLDTDVFFGGYIFVLKYQNSFIKRRHCARNDVSIN